MIGTAFSRLSKDVGWDGKMINTYPTKREIRKMSDKQLLETHRYLRSPVNETEKDIIDCLEQHYMKMRHRLENGGGE